MKPDELNEQQNNIEPKTPASGGDVRRFKEVGQVEKHVKKVFSLMANVKKSMRKREGFDLLNSRIDYKLAQRLDSSGYHHLSEEVQRIAERKKSGSFLSTLAFLHNRTPAQWLGMGVGAMGLSLLFCGLVSFALIYYRGTDIPILRNFAEQAPPLLALSKAEETEYGVVASDNVFTIAIQSDTVFRTLGLANKVTVNPPFDFNIEVSEDNSSLSVIPSEALNPGTEYTVTVRKGTMFSNGTSLSENVVWAFRTEPEFAITGITPRDGTDGAPIDAAIEIEFTHRDLDVARFQEYFDISPAVEGRFEQHGKTIVFLPSENLIPLSQYMVTVSSGFTNEQGSAIPESVTSTFRVSSFDSTDKYVPHPMMSWSEYTPILSTTQEPWIGMYSYDLTGDMNVTLYSAQPAALVDVMKEYTWQIFEKPESDHIEKIREYTMSVADSDFFNVDLNDYGIYLLEVYNESYGRSIYKFLIYSPLGIVFSEANDTTRIWLSDMNTKAPVGGGTVSFYDFSTSDVPVYEAETDENGYMVMDEAGGDFVLVEHLGNYAVGGTYGQNDYWWYSGIPWNPGGSDTNDYRAYVYTDRPLYRPGDTVHFKAIVRHEHDMVYSLPENKQVTLRMGERSFLWSGLSNLSDYEETFSLSKDFGTLMGDFVIPSNIGPGYRQLNAYVDETWVGSASFNIAEYEKPRYLYSLSLDKTLAVEGDSLNIVVSGTDYVGDPAAGQEVELLVEKYPVTSGSWIEDPEAFQSYSMGNSTTVMSEMLTLDTDGRAQKTINLGIGGYDSGLGAYRAMIWSKENYASHDSDSVLVANSTHGLFLKAEKAAVKQGASNQLTFRTAHVWDMESESGMRVKYDVTRSWTEWVANGDYYDPLTKTRKPLYRSTTVYADVLNGQEVTTDAEGYGTVNLTSLERGSYTVVATYYNGDAVLYRRFENVFYVYEPPETGEPMYSDWDASWEKIKIYTDREEYAPGDTAHIAIKTTLKGKGLYMVKRGDVYTWRVADFSSGFVEVQQEMTSEMAPYVYICAWGIDEYVSPANSVTGQASEYLTNVFRNQCVTVSVNENRGRVTVSVTPEKTTYAPGDKASIDIDVTDSSGNGVEAEVSVAVVDKALLDLVRTSYGSNTDVYAGFYEVVRQYARQYGFPFDYNYYGGGGAGGGDVPLRSNFADAAYWKGNIRTDSSGKATVEVNLPDNLTTWTIQAVAVTEDTLVGQGTVDLIARKDVRLDVYAPRYLRTGDEWEMEVDVANYSSVALSGQVSIEYEKCVDTSYSSSVQVGAGSRKTVPFSIVPRSGTDDIYVTGALTSGGKTKDRIGITIPISRAGFEQNDTKALLLKEEDEGGSMSMAIPEGADVSRATLHLTFARSFLNEWALVPIDPTVSSSVDLSSSIVHNSFFVEHYDEIAPVEKKSVFEQKIQSALDLLDRNQSSGGGYGWFDYDAVNFEVSCYVGIALGRASQAGMQVSEERRDNLKAYLWDGLSSSALSIDENIYAVYALSVLGDETVLPVALALKSDTDSFSDSPLNVAHLMLALEELGSTGDAGEMAQYLENTAQVSVRGAMWEDLEVPFRVIRSQEYITAVAFSALSPFDGIEIVEKARTWLVENPVSVYGNSPDAVGIFCSLATASLESLSGRREATKVNVTVNGRAVRTINVGGGKDSSGTVDLSVDSSYLVEGLNNIEVSQGGEGSLYVVANMTYASDSVDVLDDFDVVRTISDFETGSPVTTVEKGQVVLIKTTVNVDRNGYNLVVTDILPSGFEPVRYQLGDYDYTFYSKWWRWGEGNYVNRYGTLASDRVTFTEYQVTGGKMYTFEYPAVAAFTGTFSGGGSQSYFLGFGDVGGYILTPVITID
jgi:alpha-2-macroglobulin